MDVFQIVILTLFLLAILIILSFFLSQHFLFKYLTRKVDSFINRINKINSKKVNFKLKNAYVYAKNNELYKSLISSWTISAKEMRITTAMASLHIKHLIDLIRSSQFLNAYRYTKVLEKSTLIFEEQWNLLIKDIDEFINFTSKPNSLLIDLKQIYAEVVTLCQEILGRKTTKMSSLLQNKARLIEHLFDKFEKETSSGDYKHAYKIVEHIRQELQVFSNILKDIPFVAYLVGGVFKKQRSRFKDIWQLAKKENVVVEKLKPLKRYKAICSIVATHNDAFLSKDASSADVVDIIINQITHLSKLCVFLKAEIDANNRYYQWYVKAQEWVLQLIKISETIIKHNLFWAYSTIELERVTHHIKKIKQYNFQHTELRNTNPYPYYSDLLSHIILIINEGLSLENLLKENISKALNFEKEREKMQTNVLASYKEIKKFWQESILSLYAHIQDYFNTTMVEIKTKYEMLLTTIMQTKYNDFSILNIEVTEFLESIKKLKWEIDTLIMNENNIRKLYEIANRYRAESEQVNIDLDTVEKLIFNHDIKNAYKILRKTLKIYSVKDLKKYPIRITN